MLTQFKTSGDSIFDDGMMYWDITQSARNTNPFKTFEVTWIKADESVLFSSMVPGYSSFFPTMNGNAAITLFHLNRNACDGTNSPPNSFNYLGLRGLNPNPQTTSLVGNPWRVRKNIWIPIISGVEIIDTVTTKHMSIEFIAIVNSELVKYINVSQSNPLPIDVEAKIAGTPNTGECF
jgi:hypothetical protein